TKVAGQVGFQAPQPAPPDGHGTAVDNARDAEWQGLIDVARVLKRDKGRRAAARGPERLARRRLLQQKPFRLQGEKLVGCQPHSPGGAYPGGALEFELMVALDHLGMRLAHGARHGIGRTPYGEGRRLQADRFQPPEKIVHMGPALHRTGTVRTRFSWSRTSFSTQRVSILPPVGK